MTFTTAPCSCKAFSCYCKAHVCCSVLQCILLQGTFTYSTARYIYVLLQATHASHSVFVTGLFSCILTFLNVIEGSFVSIPIFFVHGTWDARTELLMYVDVCWCSKCVWMYFLCRWYLRCPRRVRQRGTDTRVSHHMSHCRVCWWYLRCPRRDHHRTLALATPARGGRKIGADAAVAAASWHSSRFPLQMRHRHDELHTSAHINVHQHKYTHQRCMLYVVSCNLYAVCCMLWRTSAHINVHQDKSTQVNARQHTRIISSSILASTSGFSLERSGG